MRAYAAVFWKRVGELNDAEKIIKNIERGEQKIQRQADIMTAIAAKLDKYKNPWNELRVSGAAALCCAVLCCAVLCCAVNHTYRGPARVPNPAVQEPLERAEGEQQRPALLGSSVPRAVHCEPCFQPLQEA